MILLVLSVRFRTIGLQTPLQNDRINEALSSPTNAGMIFAKVGVRGDEPLSENEMTHFLHSMMVKYVESPSA